MKIAIGADHGGYKLKQFLTAYLKKAKNKVFDVGAFGEEACDYPDFADEVTKLILAKKAGYGILICKSGLGMSMAANRKKGIRAALCSNIKMVQTSRRHNDANILVLGANYIKKDLAKKMCKTFLDTEFAGGRHARRVKKIDKESKR